MHSARKWHGHPAHGVVGAGVFGRGLWPFVLVLGGCGPAVSPLTIEVRDAATHAPAAGLAVFADVPSRYHPFALDSILGQTGPDSAHAETDRTGRATVGYVPGRPVRLGVIGDGWATGVVLIEPGAVDFDAAAWHVHTEPLPNGLKLPEFRVITATTSH